MGHFFFFGGGVPEVELKSIEKGLKKCVFPDLGLLVTKTQVGLRNAMDWLLLCVFHFYFFK